MEGSKGGEVRRVHVVYFLSHDGNVEQPHLIRVHHLHRNGVHLRDVKRWLSDIRGKDMPDLYAWSYKRRYKAGYVWQDLIDDDLITPIADNEYVLKGSKFSPKTDIPPLETISGGTPPPKNQHETLHIETDESISPKPPPLPDQESPGAPSRPPPLSSSDRSDESTEQASVIKIDIWKQEEELKKDEEQAAQAAEEKEKKSKAWVANGRSNMNSKNRYQEPDGRASHVLRNLLRCRVVETKDSALQHVHRRERTQLLGSQKRAPRAHKGTDDNSRKGSKKTGHKIVSAAYKPVMEPNCSQCKRPFKPEKLQLHMKSCKAHEGRQRSPNHEKLTNKK